MTVLIHVPIGYILTITTPCCGFSMIRWPPQASTREFMVAGEDNGFTESRPALPLRFGGSKKSAGAGGHRQKRKQIVDRDSSFHGQFNTSLWLALSAY